MYTTLHQLVSQGPFQKRGPKSTCPVGKYGVGAFLSYFVLGLTTLLKTYLARQILQDSAEIFTGVGAVHKSVQCGEMIIIVWCSDLFSVVQ